MESAHFDSIKQIIIYHHVAIMSSLLFRAVNGEANEIERMSMCVCEREGRRSNVVGFAGENASNNQD